MPSSPPPTGVLEQVAHELGEPRVDGVREHAAGAAASSSRLPWWNRGFAHRTGAVDCLLLQKNETSLRALNEIGPEK